MPHPRTLLQLARGDLAVAVGRTRSRLKKVANAWSSSVSKRARRAMTFALAVCVSRWRRCGRGRSAWATPRLKAMRDVVASAHEPNAHAGSNVDSKSSSELRAVVGAGVERRSRSRQGSARVCLEQATAPMSSEFVTELLGGRTAPGGTGEPGRRSACKGDRAVVRCGLYDARKCWSPTWGSRRHDGMHRERGESGLNGRSISTLFRAGTANVGANRRRRGQMRNGASFTPLRNWNGSSTGPEYRCTSPGPRCAGLLSRQLNDVTERIPRSGRRHPFGRFPRGN